MTRENGLTTSLDIQWDPAEKWNFNYKEVLPFVNVFLPNEQEVLSLTGENNLDNAITILTNYCKNIVVKLGSKGSIVANNGKSTLKKSYFNKNVIDAIGAGDSFNAGFIFKFINGNNIEECQSFGNLTGAINTTTAGGTAAFINYNQVIQLGKEKFGFTE
jgi:sugar/nucleoside kinase (ribokinase family)